MLILSFTTRRIVSFAFLSGLAVASGCGGSSAVSATSSTNTTSIYPAVYKTVKWASNSTVTFSGSCTLSFASTGVPAVHDPYYLGPVTSTYTTIVASTPISHLQLAVIPYTSLTLRTSSATVNICPTAASSSTATQLGVIGFLINGIALFNAYEGTGTPALSDNVSYSFTDPSGNPQTASFLDSCAEHAAPGTNGSTWHAHGLPSCVTALVDTATGPSHLIGFALDGFPIYGDRDANGAAVTLAQLDACNGITSATPEFPAGAYHYVLPIGVTGKQSSLPCYTGTVSATAMAEARKLACKMPKMAAGM